MSTGVLVSEVGPRDGLQSIERIMPLDAKKAWVTAEAAAGVREIEVGSFVPARLLPQLADTAEVVAHARQIPGLTVAVLVPNLRGAEAAVERAKLELEYTTISAPLCGRIDRRLISVGNLVQADQTVLTTIVSLDPIDFYFDVDERRLLSYASTARARGSSLQQGGGALEVMVRIADQTAAPFKGKLDFAENRVDNETGTRAMVNAIERESGRAAVPFWPWAPLVQLMRVLPPRLTKPFA